MKKVFFLLIVSMMMLGCQRQEFSYSLVVLDEDLVPGVVEYTVKVPYKRVSIPRDRIGFDSFSREISLGKIGTIDGQWVKYEEAPHAIKAGIESKILLYFKGVDVANVDFEELDQRIDSPYLESLNYTPGMEYLEAMRGLDSARRELAKAEAGLEEAKAAYVMNSFCEEMRQKINEAVADTNAQK